MKWLGKGKQGKTDTVLSSSHTDQLVQKVPIIVQERIRVRMESREDLHILPNSSYCCLYKLTE